MKYARVILLLGILIAACNAEDRHAALQNILLSRAKRQFSEAAYVEVISYPDRMLWDTFVLADGSVSVHEDIVEGTALRIDSSEIVDRIRLSGDEKMTLFRKLYYFCSFSESSACYEPRHAIILRKKNGDI